jgi:putative transposase
MARYRSVWPVRWMSQALDVSASGFYEWLNRPESNRATSNRVLLVRIRESFDASHHTYGVDALIALRRNRTKVTW